MREQARRLARLVVSALVMAGAWSAIPFAAAQSGDCSGGGCAIDTQYPTGTQSTTSSSFVTVANDIFAGEWARYAVSAGHTYEWSICAADGGFAGYDATLTLRTDTTPGSAICFSDDHCGTAPKIRWTATGTGTVRVQVNEYVNIFDSCGFNASATTLRWRCATCVPASTALVYDAWWTAEVDQDGDGCRRSATLNWDPDVADCVGTLSVFEKIYWKPSSGSTWTLLTTTSAYALTGCPDTDARALPIAFAGACAANDWLIEIYRVGQSSPDYSRTPTNDPSLNDHPEESAVNDAPPNQPPSNSSPFHQVRADTNAVIPPGGTISFGTGVYFQVTVSDPNPGDTIRLEVELRQLPGTFTGTANYVSAFVANGAVATTSTATGLAAGNYGWRCRVVDNGGLASVWVPEENPDFIVAAPAAPDIRVLPTSVAIGCAGARPEPEPRIAPFAIPAANFAAVGPGRKLLHAEEILAPLGGGAATTGVIVNLARDERAAVDWDDPAALADHQAAVADLQNAVLAGVPAGEIVVIHFYENLWGFSAEVSPRGLAALQDHPSVVVIEPIRVLHAQGAQGIPLMNGMTYRDTYNGSGMSIAICDTGVDYTHPRLGGGGFPNAKVIGGYDFGSGDGNPIPAGEAHGTACAGIAAGALGTVGDYIGGVAHNAKVYALKISPDGSGSASTDSMIAAWDWCVTHRNDDPTNPIKIISTSFGGGRNFSSCDADVPMMTSAAAAAVSAGMTHFVASGNDGYCDSMGWPACISHVNSVGAVYDAAFGTSPAFCVSGQSCSSLIFPTGGCSTGFAAQEATAADSVTVYSNSATFLTLLAPSNNASTTDIVGSGGYSSGDYATIFGGTSAACPYAAGAAAALQSAAKAITGSFLTPAAVKATLTSTGVNRTDPKSGITKPRINLTAAIDSLGPPPSGDCFTIHNDGNATLSVSSITKPSWATLVPAPPYSIAGGSSQEVCVQACGSCAGSDLDGTLTVNSNDPDEPSLAVSVHVDCPAIVLAPVIMDIGNASIEAPNAYTGPAPTLLQGTLPVAWSLVSPPGGMTINTSSGVVSWPASTSTGSPHTITIRATNSAGSDDETWLLTVTAAPPAPCPGDANGDRVVSFADITKVLENWGVAYPGSTGPGDANGDGVVSFADITKILENWGVVCP